MSLSPDQKKLTQCLVRSVEWMLEKVAGLETKL